MIDPRCAAAAYSAEATAYSEGRRRQVIAAAQSWLGTPYHHMGRLKGVGCDCLTLLAAVYHEVGIVPAIEIPFYPPDWHLHRSAERYLEGLLEYAREVDPIEIPGSSPGTEPGNIAVFRFGRCFAHGAIVISWPRVIHAWNGLGVVCGDATKPCLADRAVRFFNPFSDNSARPPNIPVAGP
jgi:NlpC/P60 family putative phage cell wall peptidase